jgi:hypothetical protein
LGNIRRLEFRLQAATQGIGTPISAFYFQHFSFSPRSRRAGSVIGVPCRAVASRRRTPSLARRSTAKTADFSFSWPVKSLAGYSTGLLSAFMISAFPPEAALPN